ncbi:MAG: ribosome modulation factor [Pseudomonadales bacterium]|nr:ribosome modulation factor [Pseudomonadales bacterium]
MKRQRRDRSELLYTRGFQVGARGRSLDICPYTDINLRQHWMAGWREGRMAFHQGMVGASLLATQPMNSVHI